MANIKVQEQGLTRRSFVKATAVAAGATAFSGGTIGLLNGCSAIGVHDTIANGSEEQIFSGACRPNCMQVCHLNVHVREGKITRTSMAPFPDERYNRICIKGLSHVQRTYGEARLKYPMRRVGERGEGNFERITWDEALDEIAQKWLQFKEESGPGSIYTINGNGNYGMIHGGSGLVNRLNNAMESTSVGQLFDVNSVHGFSRVMGNRSIFWNTNELTTLTKAKNILIWGGNITETETQDWHFVMDAKEAGARIIVIDPVYTTSASKADWWIPIRQASDAALGLAMIKLIIENEWMDLEFVKSHTVAPFLVKESDGRFLRRGDIDGRSDSVTAEEIAQEPIMVWDKSTNSLVNADSAIEPAIFGSFTFNGIKVTTALDILKDSVQEYTPEYTESLTTVKPETIHELTRIYALEGPSTIYPVFGTDRYDNGHHACSAMATIAALTGNLGKEGAGCGVNTFWDWIAPSQSSKQYDDRASTSIPVHVILEIVKTGQFNGEEFPRPRMLYLPACNLLGDLPSLEFKELFKEVEFVVVIDQKRTDTTDYADIVLPAAQWFELRDIASYATHPHFVYSEKAIEPLYECKPDAEIAKLLAAKLGCPEVMEIDEDEYLEQIFNNDPRAIEVNLTLQRLKDEKVVRNSVDPVIYGENGEFNTPTGRVEFYIEDPKPFMDWGQELDIETERLPRFLPPMEAWFENPLHEKYPLIFVTEHSRWRAHTQFNEIPVLNELDPEPLFKMNKLDADARGLIAGDIARAYNDRGECVAKVAIDNALPPGTVNMPRGFQRYQIIKGGYQELCQPRVSPNTGNWIQFDNLIEIEKV